MVGRGAERSGPGSGGWIRLGWSRALLRSLRGRPGVPCCRMRPRGQQLEGGDRLVVRREREAHCRCVRALGELEAVEWEGLSVVARNGAGRPVARSVHRVAVPCWAVARLRETSCRGQLPPARAPGRTRSMHHPCRGGTARSASLTLTSDKDSAANTGTKLEKAWPLQAISRAWA